MIYKYCATSLDAIQDLLDQHLSSLSSPIDSYLEDHIIKSRLWTIIINGEQAGCFGIFEAESLLTLFYLSPRFLSSSQPVFAEIIEAYGIKEAFAPTADELLMSLCLDRGDSFRRQAYFFVDSGRDLPDEELYKPGEFRQAVIDDLPALLAVTGDFFDIAELRINRGELFVWLQEGEVIGAGIIEPGVIQKGWASIGMITSDKHRQQGLGASILTRLKQWCYANSLTPISGCWYYNHLSKKTLEKAGMVTKTRLLRFDLQKPGVAPESQGESS